MRGRDPAPRAPRPASCKRPASSSLPSPALVSKPKVRSAASATAAGTSIPSASPPLLGLYIARRCSHRAVDGFEATVAATAAASAAATAPALEVPRRVTGPPLLRKTRPPQSNRSRRAQSSILSLPGTMSTPLVHRRTWWLIPGRSSPLSLVGESCPHPRPLYRPWLAPPLRRLLFRLGEAWPSLPKVAVIRLPLQRVSPRRARTSRLYSQRPRQLISRLLRQLTPSPTRGPPASALRLAGGSVIVLRQLPSPSSSSRVHQPPAGRFRIPPVIPSGSIRWRPRRRRGWRHQWQGRRVRWRPSRPKHLVRSRWGGPTTLQPFQWRGRKWQCGWRERWRHWRPHRLVWNLRGGSSTQRSLQRRGRRRWWWGRAWWRCRPPQLLARGGMPLAPCWDSFSVQVATPVSG